ncbi:MAG TPA: hypothetical protein VLF20_01980, partial [Patescibacteria group bacterium]|nr:hypothetical protein [Patescibacteria group bacterium]
TALIVGLSLTLSTVGCGLDITTHPYFPTRPGYSLVDCLRTDDGSQSDIKSFTCSNNITVVFERKSPASGTAQIKVFDSDGVTVDHRYKIYQGNTAHLDPDGTTRIIFAYNGGFEAPTALYQETQVKEEVITA